MASRRVLHATHRLDEAARSQLRRFRLDAGRGSCLVLCLFAIAISTVVASFGVNSFPTSMLVLPLVLGVLMLRLSQLRLLSFVVFVCAVIDVFTLSVNVARIGVLVLIVLVALVSDYTVSVRE